MPKHNKRLYCPQENVCVCPFCGKMFPVQSKLNKHLETHSVEPMFQCNLCNLKYKHERALQRHLNLVHYDKGTYTCEVCGECLLLHCRPLRHWDRKRKNARLCTLTGSEKVPALLHPFPAP